VSTNQTPPPASLHQDISADDTKRMAPVYIAVVVVQIVVLLFLWWFQESFA
jgi:hypothetical protein